MEIDIVSLCVGVVIGLAAGFVVAFFFLGKSSTKLKIENAQLQIALEKEREKLKQIIENKEELEKTFKSLASDALNQNSKQFAQLALESLKTIEAETKGVLGEKEKEITGKIEDLRKILEKFDENVRNIEIKRETAYSSLKSGQETLDKTTSELLKALKLAKGSGNWGEIQLRRIAEISGMVEHCDFDTQVYTKAEGESYYADMVVHLPQERKIIIDSKTPLSAFLKSLEESEKSKEVLIEEFVQNVKDRVKELSKKEYYKKIEGSVDFVVMFIPSEAMFSTIIEKESSFVEDCAKSNIIPASPLSLIALLKSVAYGWRQSELEIEAQTILEKARDLYNGLCSSTEHIQKLGKSLENAVESYNTFIGSVERNVLAKGREINKLEKDKQIKELNEVNAIPRELKSPDWK
ncbi:MAG: DNA recombination protein RmuC [Acidobacteria bacterium]|nr:DNA recombination protein RmuC [Acidobacteriota bacterium]